MRSFFNSIPPVTKNLLIINVLMWFATIAIGTNPATGDYKLVEWMGLHLFEAEQFNVAQLITYMFLHDPSSFGHVFFNMFSVYMFGRTLEMVWGGQRFLFYYITTGIGAGLVQEAAWYIEFGDAISQIMQVYGPEQASMALNNLVTIGASGAVFGILLAFGMLFPNTPLYLMFVPVPIKAKWFVLGYGLIELFLGVSASSDGIAHFAHLGGMLVGVIMILYWRKKGVGNGNYF
ncbi:MAG: rhomboid family intramembrane serine protease [Bacteroidaceae bacterium]|nr:rhomboid family intramembrane serine protease [Bacteroidaceae bacterium]